MEAKTLFDILGGPTKIAKLCGISVAGASQWRNTGVPNDRLIFLAAEIEKATEGNVSRQMLFPHNWKQIWPELK
jgi:DNA-binding transcriptional regulator YdaS (Cro superfamily)